MKKRLGIIIPCLVIIIIFLIAFVPGKIHKGSVLKNVSKIKNDEQSLATAIESYYIDNCTYPQPDFEDGENPIIPHSLTTPVAFITTLFHDPYRDNGKGYFGFGGGPVSPGGKKTTWPSAGWIVVSYGPDKVDGNSGVPGGERLDVFKEWTDDTAGLKLQGKGLTYDPSNGIDSPGDVWRRGP